MSFWNDMNKISEAYLNMQSNYSNEDGCDVVVENLIGELFKALRHNSKTMSFNGSNYVVTIPVGTVQIIIEKGDGTDCDGKNYARDLKELFVAIGGGLTGFIGGDTREIDSIKYLLAKSINGKTTLNENGNDKVISLEPGRYDTQFLGNNGDRFTIVFNINNQCDFRSQNKSAWWH